jgi:hypothetical protein
MKLLALLLMFCAIASHLIGLVGAPFTVVYCMAMLIFIVFMVCYAARFNRL